MSEKYNKAKHNKTNKQKRSEGTKLNGRSRTVMFAKKLKKIKLYARAWKMNVKTRRKLYKLQKQCKTMLNDCNLRQ